MTRPGPLLTPRDLAVLRSLRALRFLTCAQIQRLHFPSQETCLRRLRRLEEAGVVRRRVISAVAGQLVTLTPRGLEAAMNGEMPHHGAVRPAKLPGTLFIQHALAMNDFRIALEKSLCRHPDVELVRFISDSDRHYQGPSQRPVSPIQATVAIPGEGPLCHAADGALLLRRGARCGLFFVEIDCGTEVIGQARRGVGRLTRFHLNALAQGLPHTLATLLADDPQPDAVRVLILTTTAKRCENIRRLWGGKPFSPEPVKRLLWLSTLDILEGQDLLDAAWVSLDPFDSEPHRIAGKEPSK